MYTRAVCTLGQYVYWNNVYTWAMYTLGQSVHWGSVYTWALWTFWQCVHWGQFVHWDSVDTEAVCTLGQCAHLGSMYTRAVCTMRKCIHVGSISSVYSEPYLNIANYIYFAIIKSQILQPLIPSILVSWQSDCMQLLCFSSSVKPFNFRRWFWISTLYSHFIRIRARTLEIMLSIAAKFKENKAIDIGFITYCFNFAPTNFASVCLLFIFFVEVAFVETNGHVPAIF